MRLSSSVLAAVFILSGCGRDSVQLPTRITDLRIATRALAPGRVGVPYIGRIFGEGDAELPRWSIVAGAVPPGLSAQTEGDSFTLRGVPTVAGRFTFRVQAQTTRGQAQADFTVAVEGECPLSITTLRLPDAIEDLPYSFEIESQCGVEPLSWTAPRDAMPPGLSIFGMDGAVAQLAGRPSREGEYLIPFTVRDAAGASASRELRLVVLGAQGNLRIVTPSLPPGQVGVPYESQLVAAGGSNAGYRWRVVQGSLPPGMFLEPEGTPTAVVFGTPRLRGAEMFIVEVLDSAGNSAAATFSIRIEGDDALRITTPSLPAATVGTTYSALVTASGGAPPYRWQAREGTLPPGLSLAASGTPSTSVFGVPTVEGVYYIGVFVTDGRGDSVTRDLEVVIERGLEPLRFVTTQLPAGFVGTPYSAELEGAGGTPPYAWNIESGTLPAGLSLSSTGTPLTRISGTPQQAGPRMVAIRLRDAVGVSVIATFAINVQPALLPLQIVTQSLTPGAACLGYDQSLVAQGGTGQGYSWSVSQGNLPNGLALETTGTPITRLVGFPTAAGPATFVVTVTDDAGQSANRTFALAVLDTGAPRWATFVADLVVDEQFDAYVVDVCGGAPGNPIRITPPGAGDVNVGANAIRMSPDGRKLAFLSDHGHSGSDDLWLVDLSGPMPSSPVRATIGLPIGNGVQVSDFFWSPTSSAIAFTANMSNPSRRDLFVLELTPPTLMGTLSLISTPMVAGGNVDVGVVEWSPDGVLIAYLADAAVDNVQELWLAGVVGGGPTPSPVRVNGAISSTDDVGQTVRWLPSSNGMIYRAAENLPGQQELFLAQIAPATGNIVRTQLSGTMVNGGDVTSFELSPDGGRVAFVADRLINNAFELFTVDLSGPSPTPPLRRHAAISAPRAVTAFQWSADSTRLAFAGDLFSPGVTELFVTDASSLGGTATRVSGNMISGGDVFPSLFQWSADGRWLAYVADQLMDTRNELFAVDLFAAIPAAVRVSPPPTNNNQDVTGLSMAPNGARLALLGDLRNRTTSEMWTVELSGAAPGSPNIVNPPLPIGGDVFSVAEHFAHWKRDGSALLYLADQTNGGVNEGWLVSHLDGVPGTPVGLIAPLAQNRDVIRLVFGP